MSDVDVHTVTKLLRAWRNGDAVAGEALTQLVYERLRQLAAQRLRASGGNLSLEATDLAHELFIKLLDASIDWQSRAHFFGVVAVTLRNLLVDQARARAREKRGGGQLQVTWSKAERVAGPESFEMLALDEALHGLAREDARACRTVELSYFAGLAREQIAQLLEISLPTVDRDLRFGRAWLRQALTA